MRVSRARCGCAAVTTGCRRVERQGHSGERRPRRARLRSAQLGGCSAAELALVSLRAQPHGLGVDVEVQLRPISVGGQPRVAALFTGWRERDVGLDQRESVFGTSVGLTRRSSPRKTSMASRSAAQRLASAASASCDSAKRQERRFSRRPCQRRAARSSFSGLLLGEKVEIGERVLEGHVPKFAQGCLSCPEGALLGRACEASVCGLLARHCRSGLRLSRPLRRSGGGFTGVAAVPREYLLPRIERCSTSSTVTHRARRAFRE
jgi:hypothetical protein